MIELLSPAGSLKTLKAVINAGADAVYCGGTMYSARAYAGNLTNEELLEALDFAHMRGKAVHLTVNTLTKQDEIKELYDFILPLYERGLDAVIVQDIGVFDFLNKNFPGLSLHASTQMSVASKYGAKFLADLGAKRVVLARELSLKDIKSVHEFNPELELECFIHGALCFSYSGQCLFSSFLGGRSGNRGRCAGTCRLPFAYNGKQEYPLSLKDLCAIDFIPDMIKAGVSSFKIEGRMKQTEYAAGVTSIYREYIDKYKELGDAYRVTERDYDKLLKLGNRSGFTTGYLEDKKGPDMISVSSPSHSNEELPLSDETENKIPVTVNASFKAGENALITLKCGEFEVTATGDAPDIAQNAPATKEDVIKVLSQTGDTEFYIDSIDVALSDNLFIPKGKLKAMRRQAFHDLKTLFIKDYLRDAGGTEKHPVKEFEKDSYINEKALFVTCDNYEQLSKTLEFPEVKRIGIRLHSNDFSGQEALKNALTQIKDAGKEAVIILPNILRERNSEHFKSLISSNQDALFMAPAFDALGLLKELKIPESRVILDASVYVFNAQALNLYKEMGYPEFTYSLELSARDIRRFGCRNASFVIYGRTPFMVTEQCIKKNHNKCDKKDAVSLLTDRYKKDLIVKNYCNMCGSIIFNPVPMSVIGLDKDIEKINASFYRIDFTDEDEGKVSEVLKHAADGKPLSFETTKGHLKQSVE
ncbi:MAG: U32 family peptidase [Lachnospiraceae bacterium]|nr:U32 family peptidase [Lachnospiraceae bacterium]